MSLRRRELLVEAPAAAVILRTPGWAEHRFELRASLHTWRWGFHVKLRRGTTWRHFVFKTRRVGRWGGRRNSRELWVGWWASRRGERGPLGGWRLQASASRMKGLRPTRGMDVPIYPTAPNTRKW